eukprot:TRINITY_DN55748_c0_g1_i2.p1 TRINITY_DN55748_c0_g1~~TRINITY_DN55748_c0_g1_i2.p1  ORF type:complete len:102 (+),score=18.35 TRINITY_DN55748_c0_g1_i2:203-508(+)
MHNANTSDILLWWNQDGTGRAWEPYSISFHHNRGVHNRTLAFDARVNSTAAWTPTGWSTRQTNAYTSLVPLGGQQVMITYGMHKPELQLEMSFSMEFQITS